MHVIHFHDGETYEPEKDWKRVSLCCKDDVSVEYFVKPPHHATPTHHHPSAQILIVLKGQISITTDEGTQVLNVHDAAYIPGNEPHVVTNDLDEPSVGIDVFVPGRSFDFWLNQLQKTK